MKLGVAGFLKHYWLCCSLFAPSAHLSPENLLTCHLIYQDHQTEKVVGYFANLWILDKLPDKN
jgi:hypothetical protein